jgi:hypothetical protein
MIEVYRQAESLEADWVEAGLRELVLGYRRVVVEEPGQAPELGGDVALPAVRHDGRVISGRQALLAYLQELERFTADWRKFQGDACYIDEDGEVC